MNKPNKPTFLVATTKFLKWSLIIIAVMLGGVDISCANSNVDTFPNVDAMLYSPKPEPPILTSADAISFAAHLDNIADSLRAAQQQAKYHGWSIKVRRVKSFNGWDVRIHSMGKILPAYICTISFTVSGRIVQPGPLCVYKK